MTIKKDELVYHSPRDGFVVMKKPFMTYKKEDTRPATHDEVYAHWYKRKRQYQHEIVNDMLDYLVEKWVEGV